VRTSLYNGYPFTCYLEKFPDYQRKFIAIEGQCRTAPNLFGEETIIIPIPRSLLWNFKNTIKLILTKSKIIISCNLFWYIIWHSIDHVLFINIYTTRQHTFASYSNRIRQDSSDLFVPYRLVMKCNVNATCSRQLAFWVYSIRHALSQLAVLETNRNEREKQNLPMKHEKREARYNPCASAMWKRK